jgi:hypothetical protein
MGRSWAVRYVLIPTNDTALIVAGIVGDGDAEKLSDGRRDELAQAFERTVHTCELLVSYAIEVAEHAVQPMMHGMVAPRFL